MNENIHIYNIYRARQAVHTDYIHKENTGYTDLICTAGERHLRFWSFKRPTSTSISASSGNDSTLVYKLPRLYIYILYISYII